MFELKWYKVTRLRLGYLARVTIGKLQNVRRDRILLWAVLLIKFTVFIWICTTMAVLSGTFGQLRVPSLPTRWYENNGYLMVSSNGGLNQMRSGICDMVAIARYMNVTLLVPELDKDSFWKDRSEFKDVFDVDHFITSLENEVRIVKELPPDLKREVDNGTFHSMPPISWSNMSYYLNTILPQIQKYRLLHFQKTDARLANNDLPLDVQKFRCHVSYNALRFAPAIEKLGRKIVDTLRKKGPFLVLHLRYEMDMLAYSGCTEGCNDKEVQELTRMRYDIPRWKEKEINSTEKREAGLCPLTPEETFLTLRALGISKKMQIYVAAGDIYGGKRRLANIAKTFPNLVKKETLIPRSELLPFQNHSSQMAALDYIVSVESDIFLPTYGGHMAQVVEGHRRFLGFRKTIVPDRRRLVNLIDRYNTGTLKWARFSDLVKKAHATRTGKPLRRKVVPGFPKEEDYFWSNPQECLQAR